MKISQANLEVLSTLKVGSDCQTINVVTGRKPLMHVPREKNVATISKSLCGFRGEILGLGVSISWRLLGEGKEAKKSLWLVTLEMLSRERRSKEFTLVRDSRNFVQGEKKGRIYFGS